MSTCGLEKRTKRNDEDSGSPDSALTAYRFRFDRMKSSAPNWELFHIDWDKSTVLGFAHLFSKRATQSTHRGRLSATEPAQHFCVCQMPTHVIQ